MWVSIYDFENTIHHDHCKTRLNFSSKVSSPFLYVPPLGGVQLLVPFLRQSLHDLSLCTDESAIYMIDFIVGLISPLIQKRPVVIKCTKAAQTRDE